VVKTRLQKFALKPVALCVLWFFACGANAKAKAKANGIDTDTKISQSTYIGTQYHGKSAEFDIDEQTHITSSTVKFETGKGKTGQLVLDSVQNTANFSQVTDSASVSASARGNPQASYTHTTIDAEHKAVDAQGVLQFTNGYDLISQSKDPKQAGTVLNGGLLIGDPNNPANNKLNTNAIQITTLSIPVITKWTALRSIPRRELPRRRCTKATRIRASHAVD
jgi:hypothetical protein